MKNKVIIKSLPNGIRLFLDSETPFSEIIEEVDSTFRNSEKFFQNARVALAIEGRELSDEEEKEIVTAITNACTIKIVCIVGKKDETDNLFLKAVRQVDYEQIGNTGQFYKGTLKNGQTLETESSIVILGDIYPDASIISKKNIIILGGLYGRAYAGAGGEQGHFVAALEMAPQKIRIAEHSTDGPEKQNKWLIKSKQVPKTAFVKEDNIVFQDMKFTEELLDSLIF